MPKGVYVREMWRYKKRSVGRPKKPPWHAARFIPDADKTEVSCIGCGKRMWLPASKVGKYHSCTQVCAARSRQLKRNERERPCAVCGTVFLPRMTLVRRGSGTFCSQQCNSLGRDTMAMARRRWGLEHDGECLTPREWAERLEISSMSIRWRLKNGWPLEAALTEPRGFSGPGGLPIEGKTPRGSMSKRRRTTIFEQRDGICFWCKEPIDGPFDIDHVIPLALTGADENSNCAPMHPGCHKAKTKEDIRRISKAARIQRNADPQTRKAKRPIGGRGLRDAKLKRGFDGVVRPR